MEDRTERAQSMSEEKQAEAMPTVNEVRVVIASARADLGDDLTGLVDLIADQYPALPLETCRYLVARAEAERDEALAIERNEQFCRYPYEQ